MINSGLAEEVKNLLKFKGLNPLNTIGYKELFHFFEGKKSFDDEKIIKNFTAVIDALTKEKANNTLKGDLIKNTYLTSTMGVSYKLKLRKSI